MTSYPTGVAQNYAPPNAPLDVRPVDEQNWRKFADVKAAQTGLGMIQTCAKNAFMQRATTGEYSQFIYPKPNWPIAIRIAYGSCAPEDGGPEVLIQEFPSSIFDRSTQPNPFIDSVESGKPAVLKCRRITEDLGELYWTTAA